MDLDPSRPDVSEAILNIAEVNMDEYTTQECADISGKIDLKPLKERSYGTLYVP